MMYLNKGIFNKIACFFGGVCPFLKNQGNFLRFSFFFWIGNNKLKYILLHLELYIFGISTKSQYCRFNNCQKNSIFPVFLSVSILLLFWKDRGVKLRPNYETSFIYSTDKTRKSNHQQSSSGSHQLPSTSIIFKTAYYEQMNDYRLPLFCSLNSPLQ